MNFLSSNLLLDKLVSKCKEWVVKSNCISGSKIQNVQKFSQYSIKQTYISACIPLHISNLATITVHICTVTVILQIIILFSLTVKPFIPSSLFSFFSLLLLLLLHHLTLSFSSFAQPINHLPITTQPTQPTTTQPPQPTTTFYNT